MLHIGVFDSGVGGLSVLRSLREVLPAARFTYFADSRYAPYGERDPAHVRDRSTRIAASLFAAGADALVVACNTATALAIDGLRTAWPSQPIIGIEPGIKPAVAASRSARIGVLATPSTLRSDRFAKLLKDHANGCEVICQPCPGLAARIEQGHLDAPDIRERVRAVCEPLREAGVDVVVIGCSHYPFVQAQIAQALGPRVQIIDTAQAVARQAALQCKSLVIARRELVAEVVLMTHADADLLARLATEWLPFAWRLEQAPAELA